MQHSVTSWGMVRKQLKPRGITDDLVLNAMSVVPRHRFLDPALSKRAYSDCSLPIGANQTMSKPFMVAFLAQQLNLKGGERILDIGTGSGYQAAVLSRICKSVYSVERVFKLAARAKRLYDELGYSNISVKVGNGYFGWKEYAPYDAIVVAACTKEVPPHLIDQLGSGGRFLIPVFEAKDVQKLYVFEKTPWGVTKKVLTDCTFVKFVNC